MNKDNAKDYLPLVQALAEGREIQISDATARGGWVSIEETTFGSPVEMYRIKPEPRDIWVNEYPDGMVVVHESKASANENVGVTGVVKHYREVIE